MILNSPTISGSLTTSGSVLVNSPNTTMGQFVGNQNGYVEFSVRNASTGISASGDIAVYADNGTPTTNYIDMGINNSSASAYAYAGTVLGKALDAYLFNVGGNLIIGNANSTTPSQSLYFFANPNGTAEMTLTGSNFGIGTTVPNYKLDVSGSIRATGTIVAQTLVVQTITSSVVYSSGSNVFGNVVGNTHQFTGSVSVSGSMNVNANSLVVNTNGTVSIGNTNSTYNLDVTGTGRFTGALLSSNNQNASSWIQVSNNNAGSGAAAGFLMTNNTGDLGAISLLSSGNSPANALFIRTLSTNSLILGANGGQNLTIANGGAATFSSSVTAGGFLANDSTTIGIPFDTGGTKAYFNASSINGPALSLVSDSVGRTIRLAATAGSTYVGAIDMNTTGLQVGTNVAYPLIFATNATERMRITSGGNVGIGTTSPGGARLNIQSTSTYMHIGNTDDSRYMDMGLWVAGRAQIEIGAGDFFIKTQNANDLFFGTNSTERMRITSDGKLYFNQGSNSGYRVIIGATNGTRSIIITDPDAEGYAGGTTAMYVAKNTATGRSINAAGTINASGADYAEYMVKSNSEIIFAKGDIIGVNNKGKLTDTFSDAISFVVKSTDPSYVGGDNWFTEVKPGKTEEQTDEEFAIIEAEWDVRYQAARLTIDRIAFSGQVPCNVTGANVGDYIIPIQLENGKIGGQAITNPTFEQFKSAVGKVWKIMEDGRAWIKVIN